MLNQRLQMMTDILVGDHSCGGNGRVTQIKSASPLLFSVVVENVV